MKTKPRTFYRVELVNMVQPADKVTLSGTTRHGRVHRRWHAHRGRRTHRQLAQVAEELPGRRSVDQALL